MWLWVLVRNTVLAQHTILLPILVRTPTCSVEFGLKAHKQVTYPMFSETQNLSALTQYFHLFQDCNTVVARMKLKISTCCLAFLALVGLGISASVPSSGYTSEYLRLLAGIKSGNVTLPGQNMSASIPWVYTSQGLKFEEKLKQRKRILNFHHQVPTISISKVKISLCPIEGVFTK